MMLANALFATTVVFLALGFYLLDQCRFLIPYRDLLVGFFAPGRRFFLKDTGSKLAHLERQLRSRQSISEELSRRIA